MAGNEKLGLKEWGFPVNGRSFTMSWNVKVLLSVLVTILLLGLSAWSGLMVTSAHFGQEAYQDGRLETAERHYQTNMRVTPNAWEGWEPPFNRGTTRLRLGVDADAMGVGPEGFGIDGPRDSDGEVTYHAISNVAMVDAGVVDLELALVRVPEAERENGQVIDPDNQPECKVRRNLSIGQELQGDWLVTGGDSAAAAEKYALAQETLAACQESDENQEQSERQEQKEQENEQGGGDSDGSGNGGSDGQDDSSDPGDGQGGGSGEPNDGSGNQGGGPGANGGDLDPNMQGKEEQLRDRNRRGQDEYEDQQNQNYSGGVNW